MSTNPAFRKLKADIQGLANCMDSCKHHLDEKLEDVGKRQKLDHVARPVHEHVVV